MEVLVRIFSDLVINGVFCMNRKRGTQKSIKIPILCHSKINILEYPTYFQT